MREPFARREALPKGTARLSSWALGLAVVAGASGCGESLNVLSPPPPDGSFRDASADHADVAHDAGCSSDAGPCHAADAATDAASGCNPPCSSGCCVDNKCEETNCPAGTFCTAAAQCCSGGCVSNECQLSSMGGPCCQSSDCESDNCATMGPMPMVGKCAPPMCSMMGNKCQPQSFCDNGGDCCSNMCTSSVCQPVAALSGMGGMCCGNSDCASANCMPNSSCGPPLCGAGGECPAGNFCDNGGMGNMECCSGTCSNNQCAMSSVGGKCCGDSDCASGDCASNTCVNPG
jgi:hypothetical protein